MSERRPYFVAEREGYVDLLIHDEVMARDLADHGWTVYQVEVTGVVSPRGEIERLAAENGEDEA